MKFTEKDYAYLRGELFSNGYDLKLNDTAVYARTEKIIDIVRGKSCLHVGCCDHIPLIKEKIKQKAWLHGLLEENCSHVVGVDINEEAVAYVNREGMASGKVYCADIAAPDFAECIPSANVKFDYILLGEIIEHVDNPVLFLTSMKANMEKLGFQGMYIITVPNAFCMLRGGKYGQGIECINSDHKYWFTPYTIAKILTSAGIMPKELWFADYDRYEIPYAYQSDQLIITGMSENPICAASAVEKGIKELENLITNGNLPGALDYIETLPQEQQRQWQILNLTGIVCANCRQFKEAANFFGAALEQQPDDLDTLYNLASTYLTLGRPEKAKELLRRCEQQDMDRKLAEEFDVLRGEIMKMQGKRVLMVAYYFPPLSGSGVFRSLKFAKYLPGFGWRPTVISTDRPPEGWKFEDQSQVAEIPEDVEVVRVPDHISTGQETSVSGERVRELMDFLRGTLRCSPEADGLFSQMTQTQHGIVDLLTFPCAALSWAYDVVQYIEKNIDLNEYQAVYTTSGPFSAHLIGVFLRQKYGIPWIADYRDLWSGNPYASFDLSNAWYKLFFELEGILLRKADCNLTIAADAVADYQRRFQLPDDRIVCITNGYDEADFTDLPLPTDRTKKFTINYSGVLYTNQESIVPILKALQQLGQEEKIDLSKICFRIVGIGTENYTKIAQEYGLEQVMVQTGYLSHQDALLSNLNADLLLLLVGDDAKFRHVYTGKFFDYLRSGKPILALAPKGGAVAQVLRETGHGEAFLSTQTGQIKAMILREYRKWEKNEKSEFLYSPKIERFERQVLTEQLAGILDRTVEKASRLTVSVRGMPVYRHPKYLVICNGGYPMEGNPRCMFAHERVLQYIKAGLDVEAFGFIWNAPLTTYKYQGVSVTQGGVQELKNVLQNERYEKLLIHFVDQAVMYAIQLAGKLNMPMIIWCHGYEVLPWYRCWFNYSEAELTTSRVVLDENNTEQKKFLNMCYAQNNIHYVFVSNWQMQRSKKFVGRLPVNCQVIHNYIDYTYFSLPDKKPRDRLHILSIKNHATRTYANDLTAKAIIELSNRPCFSDLAFELYGRGKLFDKNFGKLMKLNYPNVHIYNEFLTHAQMRDLFHKNGIFLSPSRMDSHPVTTSEAMAAGMAVITSAAGPIHEFLNEDCGSLFEFDNYYMMAEEIEYLYFHPEEFLRKSQNAVQRIKTQCSFEKTIGRELKLITG